MNLQGTYTDITEIGSGGGGTVFRAYHVRMQKYVVLKKIHDNLKDSVDIRGELDILKNLRHEYLPTVLDFIEDGNSVYTVMDYIEGESFERLLGRGKRFTQAQTARYAAQLGQALAYLHGQKRPIVHGDIKPANLMLTPEDNICLIDFNISQLQDGAVSRNMGYTPGYASPEQARVVQTLQQYYGGKENGPAQGSKNTDDGTVLLRREEADDGTVLLRREEADDGTVLLRREEADDGTVLLEAESAPASGAMPLPDFPLPERMDVRSDIYSAGATLYAILTGEAPNPDFAKIVPIEEKMPDCAEGLAYLIRRCMQLRPQDRFQSAAEFVAAVAGMAKVDKRYRHLVLRQTLAAVGCILGIAVCSIVAILGKERIGREQVSAYNALVERMEELRQSEDPAAEAVREQMEQLYLEAVTRFPDRAAAYYQRAADLYGQRKFEQLSDFLTREVLSRQGSFSGEETAQFYALLAGACQEQGDLDGALNYYRSAIRFHAGQESYYLDYAIALAQAGELEEAQRALEEAVGMGAAGDRVLLAQGEIAGRQGKLEDAADYFSQCIAQTKDSYITLRAYLLWGRMYDAEPDEGNLTKKTAILSEGLGKVDAKDQAVVLEQLAQGYIDLGMLTGEGAYSRHAIDALQRVVSLGWDSYTTHSNIGILYQNVEEYDLAAREFLWMLERYGEDYRIYKRLALLEMAVQAEKGVADRDYGLFLEYYDRAKELFESGGFRADSDMEMQRLLEAGSVLR